MTSASVPASITRWAMASVSSRASGVPTGTSARSRMPATALVGTPSTRTVRAASTGLDLDQPEARDEDRDDHQTPGGEEPRASPHGGGPRREPRAGGGQPARRPARTGGRAAGGAPGDAGAPGRSARSARSAGPAHPPVPGAGAAGAGGVEPGQPGSPRTPPWPPPPAGAGSRAHHRHVTGTDRDHEVTGSHEGRHGRRGLGPRRDVVRLHPVVDPVGDERPADPGHGVLAGGVDVHDHDHVGRRQRGRQGRRRSRGCGEYRCGWKTTTTGPAGDELGPGVDHRGDLAGVVGVVVDHADPGDLALAARTGGGCR